MSLHFSEAEYRAREGRLDRALGARQLDAVLLFSQESLYWLNGYDTFGYCFFQCGIRLAGGETRLLTRAPDLRQAQRTSNIREIRIWEDREQAEPADALLEWLRECGLAGKRVGVEWGAHGLTGAHALALRARLEGFATNVDATALVPALRLVKSEAELACVRRAGELADKADTAARALTCAGADEAGVLAAMQGAVLEAGGDYSGNPFILGSGADALLCRSKTGRRRLSENDQLTLEFAGVWRHYHVCRMRTLVVGAPRARHMAMHAACVEALAACAECLRPGASLGAVFEAHARTLDAHGFGDARLNACGYSLGAVFPPSWMDTPMIYRDNPQIVGAGMVFFLHMILMDSESETAMTLGETYIVGERENERVSSLAPEEGLAIF